MRHAGVSWMLMSLAGVALQAQDGVSGQNCSYKADPDAFRGAQLRSHLAIGQRLQSMGPVLKPLTAGAATAHLGDPVDPLSLQRHNFIDDEIFNTLAAAGVQSAPLTTDEEFLRRVSLDLTGRIPVSSDIRSFVADTNPAKRDALIDKLLNSPEFSDKWTMWLGDLMQNNITSINVTRQTNARNA